MERRHQSENVMDARRVLVNSRFMVAVSRVSVNDDGRGGAAPDPLVWDRGELVKHREVGIRVNVDLASLLGPPAFFLVPGWLLRLMWRHVRTVSA